MKQASIGIIGGTGLYSILDNVQEISIDTPYGAPSAPLAFAHYQGEDIVFLPRHGKNHQYPPHRINYLANMYALKSVGVTFVISATAAGSLQKHIHPGDFVICDQFIDRTTGRSDTICNGPETVHIAGISPYCEPCRQLVIKAGNVLKLPIHDKGTAVIIQGPRFSTAAESKWFTNQGWEVINMTQYPEVVLARELEMCYANISLITDYDSGFDGERPSVDIQEAIRVFNENVQKMRQIILKTVDTIDTGYICSCHSELKRSTF